LETDCPDGPDHEDIAEYLELVCLYVLHNILKHLLTNKQDGGYPYYRDSYHYLEGFRNEYKKEYGKPPFVHRAMHWQW
jgi:hypothetical protein